MSTVIDDDLSALLTDCLSRCCSAWSWLWHETQAEKRPKRNRLLLFRSSTIRKRLMWNHIFWLAREEDNVARSDMTGEPLTCQITPFARGMQRQRFLNRFAMKRVPFYLPLADDRQAGCDVTKRTSIRRDIYLHKAPLHYLPSRT